MLWVANVTALMLSIIAALLPFFASSTGLHDRDAPEKASAGVVSSRLHLLTAFLDLIGKLHAAAVEVLRDPLPIIRSQWAAT
jgi:hypothetical protein